MWLARNSHSSPFEFYLDVGSFNYDSFLGATPETRSNKNALLGGLGAFAGPVGIQGRYESYSPDETVALGGFNLRIFGRAIQDTHVNLEYGVRGLTLTAAGQRESFQNQFAGVNAAFYLTKYFGFDGSYRKIFPATSEAEGASKRDFEGESSEAGAFIDFSFVRVYGVWRREFLLFHQSGDASSEFREGIGGGLKFFF